MNALRRTVTVFAVAAGLTVSPSFASAGAQTGDDQQFANVVESLGIVVPPGEDASKLGHRVCDQLNGGLNNNPNVVPVIRGVADQLQNSGLTKRQTVGLMRASVIVYCPQHIRLMPR